MPKQLTINAVRFSTQPTMTINMSAGTGTVDVAYFAGVWTPATSTFVASPEATTTTTASIPVTGTTTMAAALAALKSKIYTQEGLTSGGGDIIQDQFGQTL